MANVKLWRQSGPAGKEGENHALHGKQFNGLVHIEISNQTNHPASTWDPLNAIGRIFLTGHANRPCPLKLRNCVDLSLTV